jgi:DNA-binding GntR family transcriptional regulator
MEGNVIPTHSVHDRAGLGLTGSSVIVEPVRAIEYVASDQERERLGLLAGEMVYRASNTRSQAGRFVFEEIALPAALFPSLAFPVPSVSDLAQAFGLRLGEVVELISVATASASVATALDVPEGAPVLKVDTVVYLREGRPAAWRTVHSSDWDRLAKLKASL